MVTVKDPAEPAPLFLLVTMLKVEVPDPVTDAGVRLAIAPFGKPETLKLTVPLNPNDGVIETV